MTNQYYRNTPARRDVPPDADGEEAVEIIHQWKSDAAIRAEFGQLSTFAAWHKANKAGLIRVLGSGK